MFDVAFSRTNKIDGGYKVTICRIYRVYGDRFEILVDGKTYWNNEQDIYDLRIGKREAFMDAYSKLSGRIKRDFDKWLEL